MFVSQLVFGVQHDDVQVMNGRMGGFVDNDVAFGGAAAEMQFCEHPGAKTIVVTKLAAIGDV